MAFIDANVVNVALPVLQQHFEVPLSAVQWVVEIYYLLLGALVLAGGALGDQLGRRRLLISGIVFFATASVVCGMADDIYILIAGRGLQGIGAALMVPASLAVLSSAFPATQQGRAVGTWTAVTAAVTAGGPLIGGWMIEFGSWRWIFFLNVPLAVFAIGIALWKLPADGLPRDGRTPDWAGAIAAILGLGGITFGLVESGRFGLTSPVVVFSIAFGIAAIAGFLWIERKVDDPMLPPALLRMPAFAAINAVTFLLYLSMYAAMFFLPFVFLHVMKLTPFQTGAAMLPLVGMVALSSLIAGRLVDRIGARRPILAGITIGAAGLAALAQATQTTSYLGLFLPAVAVLGIGIGISIPPITAVALGVAGPQRTGLASAMNNMVARVAGLLAIAIFGVVMTQVFQNSLDVSLASLALDEQAAEQLARQRMRLGGIDLSVFGSNEGLVADAVANAYMNGFRIIMWCCAGLASAAGMLAALTLARTPQAP